MSEAHGGYYVPHQSHWPIVGSIGLFVLMAGFASLLNGASFGPTLMIAGAVITILMMVGWFGTVIRENQQGLYHEREDMSYRWGMGWFIFSEVMFFAAFFGALFYARVLVVPWLGGAAPEEWTHRLLWQGFEAAWPTNGPGNVGGEFQPMGAWGLPAINTLILLSSGATVTWAHWGIKEGNRQKQIIGLAATVALGFLFVFLQAFEYGEAYSHLNLTLESGIYGSTFFMLTGFHGMHVTVGAIMLLVMLGRAIAGHFTEENHFAFEAAAWYWHFVDVVWLGLFVFVYWL
ncbi:cytochrome c oxidase subunit 3 [Thiohalorhabdus sp. Cl-TMA]|uniref:cytochrome-c oxidase n=1 Tax=Thiohalorhabdus methylotrophus TaxID=3242694 RepID=A0ABV4TPV0_9GAMM